MDDLISRQVAIDLLDEFEEGIENGDRSTYTRTREKMCNLPPTQSEITLESAIDYLHSIGWMQEHDRIMSASAQPEVILCRDCIKQSSCIFSQYQGNDGYCRLAEPKSAEERKSKRKSKGEK